MKIKLLSPVKWNGVEGKAGDEIIVASDKGNFLSSRGDATILSHEEGEVTVPQKPSILLKENLPPKPVKKEGEDDDDDDEENVG